MTTEERLKASKLDPEYERKQAKFVQPTKIKPIKVSQAFSKGEKDLYKEVEEIKMRTIKKDQAEESKRLSVSKILLIFHINDLVL